MTSLAEFTRVILILSRPAAAMNRGPRRRLVRAGSNFADAGMPQSADYPSPDDVRLKLLPSFYLADPGAPVTSATRDFGSHPQRSSF